MSKKRQTPIIVTILLFPIAIIVFCIGWAFYWIGDNKPKKKRRKPQ